VHRFTLGHVVDHSVLLHLEHGVEGALAPLRSTFDYARVEGELHLLEGDIVLVDGHDLGLSITVKERDVSLLGVKVVCLTALRVLVVVEGHTRVHVRKSVANGEVVDSFSLPIGLEVFFVAEIDYLIIEFSVFIMDIIAIDLGDPITTELSDDRCKQIHVLTRLVEGLLQAEQLACAKLPALSHHLLACRVFVERELRVLLDIDAEPADASLGPLARRDF